VLGGLEPELSQTVAPASCGRGLAVRSYLILSVDGGGARGVMPAALLRDIVERVPVMEKVSVLAGTSTGALIALGLASGMDPKGFVELYMRHGREIFSRSAWRRLTSLGGLVRSKYDNNNLQRVLKTWFPLDLKLGQLKRRIVVPSFRLVGDAKQKSWHPVVFHNFPDSPHLDESVFDVAMRSSAAPTYFPSYQGYVDGGVAANDPTAVALALAINRGVEPSEIVVISLGTGQIRRTIDKQRVEWGLLQWLLQPNIVNLILDAQSGVAQYLAENIVHWSEDPRTPVRPRAYNARLAALVQATGDPARRLAQTGST